MFNFFFLWLIYVVLLWFDGVQIDTSSALPVVIQRGRREEFYVCVGGEGAAKTKKL